MYICDLPAACINRRSLASKGTNVSRSIAELRCDPLGVSFVRKHNETCGRQIYINIYYHAIDCTLCWFAGVFPQRGELKNQVVSSSKAIGYSMDIK